MCKGTLKKGARPGAGGWVRLRAGGSLDEEGDGENGERKVESRDTREIKIHKIW